MIMAQEGIPRGRVISVTVMYNVWNDTCNGYKDSRSVRIRY